MSITVPRISPQEARQHVEASQALLVCAYDDPQKFAKFHLEGALSLDQFRAREGSLPHEKELIFYCA